MDLDMYLYARKLPENRKEYGFIKSQITILNILTNREFNAKCKIAEKVYKKELVALESKNLHFSDYFDEKDKIYDKMSQYVNIRLSKKYKEREKLLNQYIDKIELIEENNEIGYWRKHSDLHGYLEDLYKERGNTSEFNCVDFKLTKEDCENILQLAKDIINGKEPEHYSGFFWGESSEDDWKSTVEIFTEVLEKYDFDKYDIIYHPWW